MKKYAGMLLLFSFSILMIFSLGCAQTAGTETETENTEKPSTEMTAITDPNGIVLTINGMDVTKAELEKAVEDVTPPESYGISTAFRMQFLPMLVMQKKYGKELEEQVAKLNDIVKKIKAGDLTFEDAVVEYSDDPQKADSNGLMEGYVPGGTFYVVDEELLKLKEGEVSDAFASPIGAVALKVEKINKDSNGEIVSIDMRQIMLTMDKYFPEGETLVTNLGTLVQEAKVEVLDNSLLKESPQISMLGYSDEEAMKRQDEIDNLPEPETNWRDLPPDTVVAKINGLDITAGRLKEVTEKSKPAKSKLYNYAITKMLVPSLGMKGYFKEYHEQIFKQLNDIKKDVNDSKMTFEEAQEKFSTDPGKAQGYVYEGIGEGQFVPEFEDVMFTIPLHEISEPFLSQFGGHILVVENEYLDEKGERETVDVRHLLLGFDKAKNPDEPIDMQTLQNQIMSSVEIIVHDSFIDSLLPGLDTTKKKEEEAKAEAGRAAVDTPVNAASDKPVEAEVSKEDESETPDEEPGETK